MAAIEQPGAPPADWGGFALRLAGAIGYFLASLYAAKQLAAPWMTAPAAIAIVAAILAPALIAAHLFELRQRRRDELERMQQIRAAYLAGLLTVGFAFGQAAYRAVDAFGVGDGEAGIPFDTQLALPAVGCLAWLCFARMMRLKYR